MNPCFWLSTPRLINDIGAVVEAADFVYKVHEVSVQQNLDRPQQAGQE